MLRRLARVGMALLLAGSLALTGWGVAQFAADPLMQPVVARSAQGIAATVDRALATQATPARLAYLMEQRLAEVPRNWVAIDALTALAAERGVALPADLAARLAAARDADGSASAMATACATCAWDAASCSLTNALVCHAPVAVTPAGDLLGLARAGVAWGAGDAVDQIDLGLSVVGLAATAAIPASGGSSGAVKLGAGLARMARAMGRLSPRLTDLLARTLAEAVDFAALARVGRIEDLADVVRMERLAPLGDLAADLGRVSEAVGPAGALHLLPLIDDAGDARRLARLAEAQGPRTLGVVEVLGKSRALRATLRFGDEALALIVGWLGLMASAGAALAGAAQGAALRGLRYALRRLAG